MCTFLGWDVSFEGCGALWNCDRGSKELVLFSLVLLHSFCRLEVPPSRRDIKSKGDLRFFSVVVVLFAQLVLLRDVSDGEVKPPAFISGALGVDCLKYCKLPSS